jgi:hypothetical protein
MHLEEPVDQDRPHFIVYFDLALHVVVIYAVRFLRLKQELENVRGIFRTVSRVSRRLNIAQMNMALIFIYHSRLPLSLVLLLRSQILWVCALIRHLCHRRLVLLALSGVHYVRHNRGKVFIVSRNSWAEYMILNNLERSVAPRHLLLQGQSFYACGHVGVAHT